MVGSRDRFWQAEASLVNPALWVVELPNEAIRPVGHVKAPTQSYAGPDELRASGPPERAASGPLDAGGQAEFWFKTFV
jgi:hypothetical protein